MLIARSFVFFIFFSFCGWVWETIFCTFRHGRFESRGFLYGPVCPIYGSAIMAAQVIFGGLANVGMSSLPIWATFLICMLGSAVIEYVTSWYLEMRFHARWWDYSRVPLNLNGRICLRVSFGFGLAGTLVVTFVLPWAASFQESINPLVYEVMAIVFAGVFGADFALTEANLSTLLHRMNEAEREFTARGEQAYLTVASSAPVQVAAKAGEVAARAGEAAANAVSTVVENTQGVMAANKEELAEARRELVAKGQQIVADRHEALASRQDPERAGEAEREWPTLQDRAAEIVGSLNWWQRYQLRRMTGFKPASAGARLKAALPTIKKKAK